MTQQDDGNTKSNPLQVSQLTQYVKDALEQGFPAFWLTGEISNFKRASSGHLYFSLKDSQSQIRVNMWRTNATRVNVQLRDGMEVLVFGSLSVYAPRGEYSFVVRHIEELGVGRLQAEFERLKAKLQAEGLFDPVYKKPLPFMPRKIGVVTSPTGAAIRDILRVLRIRFSGVHILIAPARVQGAGAAEEIAGAIHYLDHFGQCDLLIVGRGGGSIEDLWSFNEEIVARAIFSSKTPIISAVGHEVDFTIADFVADMRAATPSNAAEIAIRSKQEYAKMVENLRTGIAARLQRRLMLLRNRVRMSESNPIFQRIRGRLNDHQRQVAELEYQLHRRMNLRLQQAERSLDRLNASLQPQRLQGRMNLLSNRLETAQTNADRAIRDRVDHARAAWAHLVDALDKLSPLKVLSRGYAVALDSKHNAIRSPADVSYGDLVQIRVRDGAFKARVIDDTERNVQQPSLFET